MPYSLYHFFDFCVKMIKSRASGEFMSAEDLISQVSQTLPGPHLA